MKRPTLTDIAREAGVGVATVDRVLNGRAKVKEATALRVAEAAERLGFHAQGLLRTRAQASLTAMTFGFVLSKEKQPFYQNFSQEIQRAVAERHDIRGTAKIRFVKSTTPEDFSEELRALAGSCSALASAAVNHPLVTQTVTELAAKGIPFFSLLNDVAEPARHSYFGMDNIKVGRLAAWMIATKVREPGKVAVFVGGSRWHGHVLRETGFVSFLRENAPEFTLLDTYVNLDTRQVTYEATLDLLERHGDLRAIYVAGGGVEGAIAALREKRPAGKVTLIANELTDDRRAALVDGYVTMVISTPLRELCRDLIDAMIRVRQGDTTLPMGRRILEPRIFLPESV